MVRRLQIWNCMLQQERPRMAMESPSIIAWETQSQTIIFPCNNNINLHYSPTTGTWFTHISVHRHLQRTWINVQGIL